MAQDRRGGCRGRCQHSDDRALGQQRPAGRDARWGLVRRPRRADVVAFVPCGASGLAGDLTSCHSWKPMVVPYAHHAARAQEVGAFVVPGVTWTPWPPVRAAPNSSEPPGRGLNCRPRRGGNLPGLGRPRWRGSTCSKVHPCSLAPHRMRLSASGRRSTCQETAGSGSVVPRQPATACSGSATPGPAPIGSATKSPTAASLRDG